MATRVTLPPLEPTSPLEEADVTSSVLPASSVLPVAKTQLLNDRGDRRAEANWLSAAARPGVVQLLSTSEDPFTIVTAHAGARTMRTARLDPEAGRALMISVTELLTELHNDGFAHGKLTVDHVIVGGSGPVLCSPDGAITDPATDLDGIARCMRELGRQWDEAKTSCRWRPAWDDVAQRLEDASDPSRSALRTTQALRRMAAPSEPAPDRSKRSGRPIPRSVAVAGGVIALVLAGIALVPASEPAAATGPRFVVDGSTYALGNEGDDVAHLERPCDSRAPVISLRPSTGEVWAFRSIDDGAVSEPVAVVPGATELRSEQRTLGDRTCRVAVARGPAGATDIDTIALLPDVVDAATTD